MYINNPKRILSFFLENLSYNKTYRIFKRNTKLNHATLRKSNI